MNEIKSWAGVAETARLIAKTAIFMIEDAENKDVATIDHDLPTIALGHAAIARFIALQKAMRS